MKMEPTTIIHKNIVVVNSEVKFIKGFFPGLQIIIRQKTQSNIIGTGIILYGNNIILNTAYIR